MYRAVLGVKVTTILASRKVDHVQSMNSLRRTYSRQLTFTPKFYRDYTGWDESQLTAEAASQYQVSSYFSAIV
jgi:phosphoribosyl 1,2-cyclic phosphodiesterase